jgi:hypothetical protein
MDAAQTMPMFDPADLLKLKIYVPTIFVDPPGPPFVNRYTRSNSLKLERIMDRATV